MGKDKQMKTIGIVGFGIIGQALVNWLKANTSHKLLISDPLKGYVCDLSLCDIVFINIHIPTERNGIQNLEVLEHIISELPNVPIYIRTTILPGTSDYLSIKFRKKIYFMPEFLTERTAQDDFDKQTLVYTGNIRLLKSVFINKKYITMSNIEAEIAKYAHNVFGALKVTYFNAIYDLCLKKKINYKNVLNGILLSGYIDKNHTTVPGPDGKLGFGGKCFPKDVNAFSNYIKSEPLYELIKNIKKLNNIFRK